MPRLKYDAKVAKLRPSEDIV